MKCYANGRLTPVEACRLASDIIGGRVVLVPKPARSQVFAYHCHQLALAFQNTRGQSPFCLAAEALFCAVIQGTRLLEEVPHRSLKLVPLLLRLCRFHTHWRRRPGEWIMYPQDLDWEPHEELSQDHRTRFILRSLVRHLFNQYPMPSFWDAVWLQEKVIDYRPMEWYVHVASGKSLRTAIGLPIVLSKRATHLVNAAPGHLALFEALRWAQLRALGASCGFCRQVLRSAAATDFQADATIWLPLFRLLIRDTTFPADTIPSVVDYVCLQGNAYRLRRQSIGALRREMAAFYRQYPDAVWVEPTPEEVRVCPSARKARIYNWPRMGGVGEWDDVDRAGVRWRLFELRRSYLLEREGRRMGHCVGGYVGHCLHGGSSIWSLRSFRNDGQRWEATIEVDRERRVVIQVRAYGNRRPSDEVMGKIRSWADGNGLRVLACHLA